eukprot:scaffold95600_cov78-Phaeocystis_antarctica.AAC.1
MANPHDPDPNPNQVRAADCRREHSASCRSATPRPLRAPARRARRAQLRAALCRFRSRSGAL